MKVNLGTDFFHAVRQEGHHILTGEDLYSIFPEPTARSAVPGVSPGRGLLIPHGYLHPGKKANTAKCKVHQ